MKKSPKSHSKASKSKPRSLREDLNSLTELVARIATVCEDAQSSQTMLEDIKLTRRYPVMEIAKLAARCGGATADDRIEAAIELLSAAEQSASMGKKARFIMRRIKLGHSEEAAMRQFEAMSENRDDYRKRSGQAEEICRLAERSQKTGKILLSSLLGLAYDESGIGRNKSNKNPKKSAHANRLYNHWLREEAQDSARGMASEEVCRLSNEPKIDLRAYTIWTDEQSNLWEKLTGVYSKAAVAELRPTFETKTRPLSIHDDQVAFDLVFRFLRFLEERPKPVIDDTLHSQNEDKKGQFVSPKTRGSKRRLDGTFGNAQSTLIEHVEINRPNKKSKASD